MSCANLIGRPAAADFVAGGLYATADFLNQVIQINPDGTTSVALNVAYPEALAFRNANELYVSVLPNGPDGEGPWLITGRTEASLHGAVDPAHEYPGQWLMGNRPGDRLSGERVYSHVELPCATMITANGVVS